MKAGLQVRGAQDEAVAFWPRCPGNCREKTFLN
jgi:hypothetical protein